MTVLSFLSEEFKFTVQPHAMARGKWLSEFEKNQIVLLKSCGFSNRTVARRLSRSPTIVDHFVRRIQAKQRFISRSDLEKDERLTYIPSTRVLPQEPTEYVVIVRVVPQLSDHHKDTVAKNVNDSSSSSIPVYSIDSNAEVDPYDPTKSLVFDPVNGTECQTGDLCQVIVPGRQQSDPPESTGCLTNMQEAECRNGLRSNRGYWYSILNDAPDSSDEVDGARTRSGIGSAGRFILQQQYPAVHEHSSCAAVMESGQATRDYDGC